MISMKFFFAFFLALIGTVASRELQQVRFSFRSREFDSTRRAIGDGGWLPSFVWVFW